MDDDDERLLLDRLLESSSLLSPFEDDDIATRIAVVTIASEVNNIALTDKRIILYNIG